MNQLFFFLFCFIFLSYLDSPELFYDTDNWSNPLACISCELLLQHSQGTLQWELFLSTTPELHFSGKGEPPGKAKAQRGDYTWGKAIHIQLWIHTLQSMGAHFCLLKRQRRPNHAADTSIYLLNTHICIYKNPHKCFHLIIAIFS